jgi:hypothetical protein
VCSTYFLQGKSITKGKIIFNSQPYSNLFQDNQLLPLTRLSMGFQAKTGALDVEALRIKNVTFFDNCWWLLVSLSFVISNNLHCCSACTIAPFSFQMTLFQLINVLLLLACYHASTSESQNYHNLFLSLQSVPDHGPFAIKTFHSVRFD